MRTNIIIHSVSGNLYLIAGLLKSKLVEKGVDARVYRIEDSDLHLAAARDNEANEYYEDITSLPLASNEKLRKADTIVLACPAVFSLPSAEMVTFLNATLPMRGKGELEGKRFYAFASSKYGEEEGKSAITGLQLWADSMGLVIIPEPVYVHDDGVIVTKRPGVEIDSILDKMADAITA